MGHEPENIAVFSIGRIKIARGQQAGNQLLGIFDWRHGRRSRAALRFNGFIRFQLLILAATVW